MKRRRIKFVFQKKRISYVGDKFNIPNKILFWTHEMDANPMFYGMENSILVQIKQFHQPSAEPSDNSASHSSGNGYKSTPVN